MTDPFLSLWLCGADTWIGGANANVLTPDRYPANRDVQQSIGPTISGGLNFMEFYADRVVVNPLRIEDKLRAELESSLVLVYTALSRESVRIINEQAQNVRKGHKSAVHAMHVLKAEAVRMKEAVLNGDLDELVAAMQASWEAKKQMANGISNRKLDAIYEVAMKAGARAGKVSGAGGGGFMMFIVDPVKREGVVRCLQELVDHVSTCGFVEEGVSSWRVHSKGATDD